MLGQSRTGGEKNYLGEDISDITNTVVDLKLQV